MENIGVKDPKTGRLDIDRITTDISSSQRSKIFLIKEIVMELENKIGKQIPIEDVIKTAIEKGMKGSEAEEVIEKLKSSGDLFEPRRGLISRL